MNILADYSQFMQIKVLKFRQLQLYETNYIL